MDRQTSRFATYVVRVEFSIGLTNFVFELRALMPLLLVLDAEAMVGGWGVGKRNRKKKRITQLFVLRRLVRVRGAGFAVFAMAGII